MADANQPPQTPPLLRDPSTAPFTGYRPFPSLITLHSNLTNGLLQALTTHKLCGADPNNMLYLVEVHFGYTPRGPLHFGRGFYLRNGTRFQDPILAAVGEVFRLPLLVSLFDPRTSVLLPPADWEKNPGNKVDEILQATVRKDEGVVFSFEIETGEKKVGREEFEWRKLREKGEATTEKGSQYRLYWAGSHSASLLSSQPSSSTQPPALDIENEDEEVLAELRFNSLFSFTHLFTLELKGAGKTGELGDRWALMVVMTALGIHWLRQNGKTHRSTVKVAEKFL
ncbi:uncharacterized protein C8A04DRAFT_13193 [Dichotomopilus funicola]|uniref:Uncharacterized protein n=1 Tax=Dichotomopilus funicola TaxID=1934379 RepID=A0AAN6V0A2_9PEZI|nr:hypothetical protein C8A04DRAFT_13193 [Dichotomopilus funicola]